MLDIKMIRNNPEILKKVVVKSKGKLDTSGFLLLDENRRELLYKVEQLKNKQNGTN